MGIVVSSRQASNIFWHSVTRLNAICVLISSLQRPWPLEKRGVRWFSLFHSPASSFLSLLSLLHNMQFLFLVFSHSLSFTVFLFHSLLKLYHQASREDSLHQTEAASFVFCALVCHLASRQRQIHSQTDRSTTCSSIHFCPSALRLRRTTYQPAVFLREEESKWTASKIATNETSGRCHFFPPTSLQIFFSFLWARVHGASRLLQCLFGSGIIFHVYDTPTKSTDREGRWGQMMENANSQSLGTCTTLLFFPLSYLLFIAF